MNTFTGQWSDQKTPKNKFVLTSSPEQKKKLKKKFIFR